MLVGKSMTVAAAEELMSSNARAPTQCARVPTRAQHFHTGGEAAIVQALVTWAQSVERPTLQTYIPDAQDADDQIGALTRQFFGLSAALLCDNATAINKTSVFTALREAASIRLDTLQSEKSREASRGPQFEVLCADHLDKGAPRLLYDRSPEGTASLKDPRGFNLVAEKIQHAVGLRQSSPAERAFSDALGGALYELFRNTDDHARGDEFGDKLKRSLRAVQARKHSIALDKLADLVAGSPPLATFCARLRPPRARNKQVQLVEVSVLDSGPGYASAFRKRPLAELSPQDEADAVRECFLKHATGKEESQSGLGLCNVVDILRENGGFLRLRTGRQSLYADLGLESGAEYGTLPNLLEWPTGEAEAVRAAGSLMTILLPLVADQ